MADDAQASTAEPIVFQIISQYIKDLSFENPGAPQSIAINEQPQIAIKVDVAARALSKEQYEVSLKLGANAKHKDQQLFLVEIEYGGVLIIKNLPEDQLRPALLIEAPRQLFPFARAVLANITGDAGYPPLLLQPIDFVDLYRKNIAAAQQQLNEQTVPPGATIN